MTIIQYIKKILHFEDIFVDYIYGFFKKKAPFIDKKWFLQNKKNQQRAAVFFFYTSNITSFFFFSKIGRFLMSIFFASSFFFSINYFRTMVVVFADLGFVYGIYYMISGIPLILSLLFFFVIFLMDLSLINTFLICCPSVSKYIKCVYGPDFLKKKHYNSATLTAKASAQMTKSLVTGAVAGLVAGTFLNFYGEHKYHQSYGAYLETQMQNPGVTLKPPEKGFGLKIGFGK
jgi:hypothetical protein